MTSQPLATSELQSTLAITLPQRLTIRPIRIDLAAFIIQSQPAIDSEKYQRSGEINIGPGIVDIDWDVGLFVLENAVVVPEKCLSDLMSAGELLEDRGQGAHLEILLDAVLELTRREKGVGGGEGSGAGD